MYPLVYQSLSLLEISRHWSRDLPQHPPWKEVLELLLGALWKGEIKAFAGPTDETTRESLLRLLARLRGQPGILIYSDPTELPPDLELTPDGGAIADARERLYLPADPAVWTRKIEEDAFNSLTACKVDDYCDAIAPILGGLEIAREDFKIFCHTRGYPCPTFWFGAKSSSNKPTSYGGRPSVMAKIKAEMRRRALANELAPTLRKEALALHEWAVATMPKEQNPTPRSIENAIRSDYRELKARALSH